MTSSIFKKDENDNTVFYPWGVLARGYILPDMATEQRLRRVLSNFYVVTFASIPFIVTFFKGYFIWILVGSFAIGFLFQLWLVKSISGAPRSEDKLFVAGSQSTAQAFGLPTLLALVAASILMTAGSILLLFHAKTQDETLVGVGGLIMFGLAGLKCLWMLRLAGRKRLF